MYAASLAAPLMSASARATAREYLVLEYGASKRGGPADQQSVLAYLIAWVLLLAAPRPLVELLTDRRRSRTSDPDQLARLTRLPAMMWILLMLVADLAGLVVGVSTLAPDLLSSGTG